jgi:hypothetical protein
MLVFITEIERIFNFHRIVFLFKGSFTSEMILRFMMMETVENFLIGKLREKTFSLFFVKTEVKAFGFLTTESIFRIIIDK